MRCRSAPSAVLHLAQSRRYREFPEGVGDVYAVNVGATVALLDYARRAGATTFTYASSGAVYAPGPEAVRETDLPAPGNFYAASKLAGELATEQFRGLLRGHILRFFFIYGPGQRNMFIPGLLGRLRERQEVTLAGPDGIHVNPVFVDDAAAAVAATLEAARVHDAQYRRSRRRVAPRQSRSWVGVSSAATPSSRTTGPQPDLVAAIDRMSATVGAPAVGFEEGLRRTAEMT